MTDRILLKKLNSLLYKFRGTERYKKIKLPLSSLEKVKSIPFSTRDDLKDFDLSNAPLFPFNITATSGSTKSKLIIGQSSNCYSLHLKRQIEIYGSIGLKKRDCCLNLCAYSLNGAARIMENALKQMGITVIPFGEIRNNEQLKEVLLLIKKLKPAIINSYVNQIYDIFNIIKGNHSIKKCILNGEPLFESFKRDLETISKTEIFNNYGSMEFSGFAITQAPNDPYMRIFDKGLFIEVLRKDGTTEAAGTGKIVLTDLANASMPFIRYILGDEVEIVQKNKTRFIRVLRRCDDYILLHGEVESKKEIEGALLNSLKHPYFCLMVLKDKGTFKDKIILNLYKGGKRHNRFDVILKKKFPFLNGIKFLNPPPPKTTTGKFKHFLDLR